jgi:hypothetical protein
MCGIADVERANRAGFALVIAARNFITAGLVESPACPRLRTGRRKQKGLKPRSFSPSWDLAEWTGLEPATPGVTGRYSNQLNYHSRCIFRRTTPRNLVGAEGIEPPTFAL